MLLNKMIKKLSNSSLFLYIYSISQYNENIFSNKAINMFSSYLVQVPWMVSFSFDLSELPLKLYYFSERKEDPIWMDIFNLHATFSLFCQPQTRITG